MSYGWYLISQNEEIHIFLKDLVELIWASLTDCFTQQVTLFQSILANYAEPSDKKIFIYMFQG